MHIGKKFGVAVVTAGIALATAPVSSASAPSFCGEIGGQWDGAYCHTTAKIEKKKGYGIALVNKNPLCMGAGCHPLK